MIFLLPTDTCYGLAGAINKQDFQEIYRLKGRDFSKQLAILVENYEDMRHYIEISDDQIEFLKSYPHPWSFLGKRNPIFVLPDFLDAQKYEFISIRVASVCLPIQPSHYPTIPPFPLFLTSANTSGKLESKTLSEAREYFPGVEGIDGGVCDHLPSDIFSLDANGEVMYLRRNYGI